MRCFVPTLRHPQRGAALLLTLIISAMLVAALVAYLYQVRVHLRQAAQVQAQIPLDSLTRSALLEARERIEEGFRLEYENGRRVASAVASPGLMEVRFYHLPWNRGRARGPAAFAMPERGRPFFTDPFGPFYDGLPANPRWIPLYSTRLFAPAIPRLTIRNGSASDPNPDYNPAAVFNINTPRNPFYPGEYLLSGTQETPVALRAERDSANRLAERGREATYRYLPGEHAAERPVHVQWIPWLRDPALPPGPDNRMIGRYAYWIDVENTKINLNTASRSFRQQSVFPLLSGDPDALARGTGSYFTQTAGNPAYDWRHRMESSLPIWSAEHRPPHLASRIEGPGTARVGRAMVDLLLNWQNGQRPWLADCSLVDWDYFSALRPWADGAGDDLLPDAALEEAGQAVASGATAPLASAEEIWAWLIPELNRLPEAQRRLAPRLFRKILTHSTTVVSYDDERDPLGRPKIDLVKFQLENRDAAAAGGNPLRFRETEIWRRLADPDYHRAYHPAATPNQGTPRSFIEAFNSFAGNGDRANNANGELAVMQILANLAGSALDHTRPPLIDEARGIVTARSSPYVLQFTTRVRSALWQLPEADRQDFNLLLARDADGRLTYQYNGRPLAHYLTRVLVDAAVACINADPWADGRPFQGKITLKWQWQDPRPQGAELKSGPAVAELAESFFATPLPAKEPGNIWIEGDSAHFELGELYGEDLLKREYATALRIEGWEIRNDAGLWHKVPVRNLGAPSVRAWWEMTREGANVGKALQAYHENASSYGHRAVGWISAKGIEAFRKFNGTTDAPPSGWEYPNALFFEGTRPRRLGPLPLSDVLAELNGPLTDDQVGQIRQFLSITLAKRSTLGESLLAGDPVLGHRTGHPELPGAKGKGHVYGALGHVWRHQGTSLSQKSKETTVRAYRYRETPGADWIATVAGVEGLRRSNSLRRLSGFPSWQAELRQEFKSSSGGFDGPLRWFGDPERTVVPLAEFNARDLVKKTNRDEDLTFSDGSKIKLEWVDRETDRNPLPGLTDDQYKPLKIDGWDKRSARGFFCSSPPGRLMVSLGEIGRIHSGFPHLPILLLDEPGWNEFLLDSPQNGPPMRMLLDLFTPGAFTDPASGHPVPQTAWQSGKAPSYTPTRPRRGTWSINTSVAHDGYMALREGSTGQVKELKKEQDVSRLPARVIWCPNGSGFRRRATGNEAAPAHELKKWIEGKAGEALEPGLHPFPKFRRAWDAWLGLISGDFTPGRSLRASAWGYGNRAFHFFGGPAFTWCPGNGVSTTTPRYRQAQAEFGPGPARLVTWGSEGRKDDKNENDGMMRARFSADQFLDQIDKHNPVTYPVHFAPRFSLFPMRHFLSDLSAAYHYDAPFSSITTPLNPKITTAPPAGPNPGDYEKIDGAHFPGGFAHSGIYAQAPLILMANQATTSSNTFTIWLVAQIVRDNGKLRPEQRLSGPGFCDPDDEVVAERWTRALVARLPPRHDTDTTPRFAILALDSR